MSIARVLLASVSVVVLTGCATMTVTKVGQDGEGAGIRYSLPKPFIQVVPQADGSVAVDVVYLPDVDHTYAISTSAFLAAYAFQVTLEQGGYLNKIELKQNTAAVLQQAAASAGGMAVQAANIHASQMVAAQTLVDQAQAAADDARGLADAADAKVKALEAQTPPPTADTINTAKVARDEARAKQKVKEDALRRAQTSARAVAVNASAATPISTTAPGLDTRLAAGAWAAPAVFDIPGNRGAVLFAVNEGMKDGKPFVHLNAAKLCDAGQPSFEIDRLGTSPDGKPALRPNDQSFPSVGLAEFTFSAPIARITGQKLEVAPAQEGATPSPVPDAPQAQYDRTTGRLRLPLMGLAKQRYKLSLEYEYRQPCDPKPGDAIVHFTVQ